VFCTTWVHSFSGVACDLEALGAVCRANGTWLVVNASQALGARLVQGCDLRAFAIAGKWGDAPRQAALWQAGRSE
jgi:selenocysteine lyase/cysteine desulfurase